MGFWKKFLKKDKSKDNPSYEKWESGKSLDYKRRNTLSVEQLLTDFLPSLHIPMIGTKKSKRMHQNTLMILTVTADRQNFRNFMP